MEQIRGSGSDDPAGEVAGEQANHDHAELVQGDQQEAHALPADSVNSGQRNGEESVDKQGITTTLNTRTSNRPSMGLAQIDTSSFYDKSNFRVGLQVSRAQDLNLLRNKGEPTMYQTFLGPSDPHGRQPHMR